MFNERSKPRKKFYYLDKWGFRSLVNFKGFNLKDLRKKFNLGSSYFSQMYGRSLTVRNVVEIEFILNAISCSREDINSVFRIFDEDF